MNRTVHGTRIERFLDRKKVIIYFTPLKSTQKRKVLGHLSDLIYLRKPIPCYYLVYVEVLLPFAEEDWAKRSFRPSGVAREQEVVGLLITSSPR